MFPPQSLAMLWRLSHDALPCLKKDYPTIYSSETIKPLRHKASISFLILQPQKCHSVTRASHQESDSLLHPPPFQSSLHIPTCSALMVLGSCFKTEPVKTLWKKQQQNHYQYETNALKILGRLSVLQSVQKRCPLWFNEIH